MALGLPLRVSWLCFLLVSIGFCYHLPPKGSPSGIGGDDIGPSWPTQLFSRQFTGSSSAIGDDNRGSSWPNRISSRRFTGSLSAIGDDNRGSSWPTLISSKLFSNTPRESSSFSKWPHYSEAAQPSHHTLQPPSTPRDIAVTHSVYGPVVESTYEQPEPVGFYPPAEPEPARYPHPPAEPEPARYPRPPVKPQPAIYPRPPVKPEPAIYPRPPVKPEPARYPLPPVKPEPARYPLPPVKPEPARYPRPPVEPEPARYPRPPAEPASLYLGKPAEPASLYPRPPAETEPAIFYPAAIHEYSTWPITDPEPEAGPSISGEYQIAPAITDFSSSPPMPSDHTHDSGDLVGTRPSVHAVNLHYFGPGSVDPYVEPPFPDDVWSWPITDPEPEDGLSISGEYEISPAITDFSSSPPMPTDHTHDSGDLVGTEPSEYAVNLHYFGPGSVDPYVEPPIPDVWSWPRTEPEDGPSISGEYDNAPAITDFSSFPARPTDHTHDSGDLVGTEPSEYAVNLHYLGPGSVNPYVEPPFHDDVWSWPRTEPEPEPEPPFPDVWW